MNKIKIIFSLLVPCFIFLIPSSCIAQNPDTTYHQFTYGGNNDDYAHQIISTADSGYIVVGSTASFGTSITNIYVIKIDSIGNKVWSHVYLSTAIEWGYSIRQTFDNGYIISGFTNKRG